MILQKNKSNVFVKILLCITLVCTAFGALFFGNSVSIFAKAETTDITDTITLDNRNTAVWNTPSDEFYFGVKKNDSEYINTAAASGTWYVGNDDVITNNNGVDIMEYIYVNGESARAAITANASSASPMLGSKGWLTNPAASPVYVETSGANMGIMVHVLKAYSGESFTLTFKAGFALIDSMGATLTISKDVNFNVYPSGLFEKEEKHVLSFADESGSVISSKDIAAGTAIGELPAVPEKEGSFGVWQVDGKTITADTQYAFGGDKTAKPYYYTGTDITDTIAIDNRAWANYNDVYYFGLWNNGANLNTHADINGVWITSDSNYGPKFTENNDGCDILEYLAVNGVPVRTLINQNILNNTYLLPVGGSGSAWLGRADSSPVYVETTNGSGVMIQILKAFAGDSFTFTIKKGFTVLDESKNRLIVLEDREYTYENGTFDQDYTLSFEGTGVTKELKDGETIGELPAIPEKANAFGVWQIDGENITEKTVYNYGINKTAKIVYLEGTEISDTLEMENWGTAAGADCTYIRIGTQRDKDGNLIIPTVFNNIHWQDGYEAQAPNNYGCDLMEYIYINGKSARELANENNVNRTYGGEGKATTFPFTYGGIFAPVDVYTNGNEFIILVMTDYVAKDALSITLKAGFRMATPNGGMVYLSKDYIFPYYTVTIDGETKRVAPNTTIEEPVAPTKAETESHTYTFDGWYNGDTKWDFSAPVTESMTLTAKFIETEKTKYTVTFCANNGSEDVMVSVYINVCIKNSQIPADPEKDGGETLTYTFLYWSLDGNNAYDFTTPITEDITLTAVYTTQKQYKVTIGDQTVKVLEGGKIAKPTDPTRESTAEYDYIFDGWYNGETKWNFETDTVNSDLTLTAKYNEVKRKYTITFNVTGKDGVNFDSVEVEYGTIYDLSTLLDGIDLTGYTYRITVNGTAVTSVEVVSDVTVEVGIFAEVYYTVTIDGVEQSVKEGNKVVKPETEPTKESTAEYDYIFDGWYNGETKWNFETDIVMSDLTLEAKYNEVKRKYTITFSVTGKDGVTFDPVEVEYGTIYDLSTLFDGVDLTGYTYRAAVNGTAVTSVEVVSNVTVEVSIFEIVYYTVTMDGVEQSVKEGEKAVKPETEPTKEATVEYEYIFDGWYNGETKWNFETDTVNSDLTLTAKYNEVKRKYTITFNVTGKDGVNFDSVEVEYGTIYDLSTLLDGIDLTGYTYRITVNGTAVTSVEVVSDVTVEVGVFAEVYYTVTIDGVEQSVKEGDKAVKPETEPTKESTAEYDYTFDGWYNGETKWNFETDTVNSDLTLTAKYNEVKRKYTITFNVTGNEGITLAPVEVEYGTIYDLSKLLEGKDVSGYTYYISVGGVEKITFKVIGDTTVDVVFTKKANDGNEASKGCGGVISGATGTVLCIAALGALLAAKKKEN